MNILKRKISKHSVVIGLIIAAGFLLRFRQYFYNKSLWLDEASLALNIIHRPWWQLFKPLDYLQGAPVGFLLIEKFFIYLFGSGEYVLRLFPFISALAALFLFFNVARFLLDRDALVLAMTLMSFSGVLIYYSSECKQYSSDVFLALIVLNIFLRPYRPMISVVRALALGLMCAVFIFISHPIFFVLLGIAVVNVGSCIREKKWLTMAGLLSVFVFGLISFVIAYFVSLRSLTMTQPLVGWSRGFVPHLSFSLRSLQSLTQWFQGNDSLGFLIDVRPAWVSLGLLVIGSYSMFRERRRDFLILGLPVFFVFVASVFHKYPFYQRMLLFLIPSVLIILSKGFSELLRFLPSNKVKSILIILCMCFLLFVPVVKAMISGFFPYGAESLKPVLSYVSSYARSFPRTNPTVYLSNRAVSAFQYYAPRYGLDKNRCIVMPYKPSRAEFKKDMNRLVGTKKVWVIASGISEARQIEEESFYLGYLDRKGPRLRAFKCNDASAYLYDLSRPRRAGTNSVPAKTLKVEGSGKYVRRATRALWFIERVTGSRCVPCLLILERFFNALRAYVYS